MILPSVRLVNNAQNTASSATHTHSTSDSRDNLHFSSNIDATSSIPLMASIIALSTAAIRENLITKSPHIMSLTTYIGVDTTIDQNNNSNQEIALYEDAIVLSIITIIGLVANGFTMIKILTKNSLRKVTNMFLLHHCAINFLQSTLCIPFIIALLTNSKKLKGCEIFGGAFVTMVTASILNIAAMVAAEAYQFEDIIVKSQNIKSTLFEGNNSDNDDDMYYSPKKANQNKSLYTAAKFSRSYHNGIIYDNNESVTFKTAASTGDIPAESSRLSISNNQFNSENISTASCSCAIFGVIMIWLASIILHLGITLIGSDSKQFYNHAIRNCFFIIGDRRTYILYIMWISVTLISIALIIKYVIKIYKDVSKHKRLNASSFLKLNSIISRNQEKIDYYSYFILKNANNIDLKRFNTDNNSNTNSSCYDFVNIKNNGSANTKRIAYYKQKTHSLPLTNRINNSNNNYNVNNNHASENNHQLKSYDDDDDDNDKIDIRSSKKINESKNNTISHLKFPDKIKKMKFRSLSCSSHNINSVNNNKNISKHQKFSERTTSFLKRQRHQQNITKQKYKRNYDIIKQILQKIKIQFIVVIFFILCWLPLFITVSLDARFEVSPTVYRYLTILACSNASITPFCYLTILIPKINKFCFPCLRTDGKRSKNKSKLYDAMTNYYDKLGDRFHNSNSTNSLTDLYSAYINNENEENVANDGNNNSNKNKTIVELAKSSEHMVNIQNSILVSNRSQINNINTNIKKSTLPNNLNLKTETRCIATSSYNDCV